MATVISPGVKSKCGRPPPACAVGAATYAAAAPRSAAAEAESRSLRFIGVVSARGLVLLADDVRHLLEHRVLGLRPDDDLGLGVQAERFARHLLRVARLVHADDDVLVVRRALIGTLTVGADHLLVLVLD